MTMTVQCTILYAYGYIINVFTSTRYLPIDFVHFRRINNSQLPAEDLPKQNTRRFLSLTRDDDDACVHYI